jgi:uncharacterized protein (DUF2141 family)
MAILINKSLIINRNIRNKEGNIMKRVYKAQNSFKSKVTSSHIHVCAHDQAILSVSEEQLVYVVHNI